MWENYQIWKNNSLGIQSETAFKTLKINKCVKDMQIRDKQEWVHYYQLQWESRLKLLHKKKIFLKDKVYSSQGHYYRYLLYVLIACLKYSLYQKASEHTVT
jgi:hypothetical protein